MRVLFYKIKNLFKSRREENPVDETGGNAKIGSKLFGGAASDLARSIHETERRQLRKKFWRNFFH